jgi:hypothetical protein
VAVELPVKRLLDKSFKYVPSQDTDVAATFRRIRKEIQERIQREQENQREADAKTVPLKRISR